MADIVLSNKAVDKDKGLMASPDFQVLGLCRFSYPALGGFQVEHETLDERRAYLYAPERMEERFRTLEAVSLPCLRAQTDQSFRLLIVVGDCLPAVYRTRLERLVADFPQAEIVTRAPDQHRRAMQRVLNDYREDTAKLPCLQFRHDDDDAVSLTFVERLRNAARDCLPLLMQHEAVAVDFNQGYMARFGSDGISAAESFNPYLGVGFGMAIRPDFRRSIMNYGHNKVHRNMPTITFNDPAMFVRGYNDFNDSRQKAGVKPVNLAPLTDDQTAFFKSQFAIDAERVKQIFTN